MALLDSYRVLDLTDEQGLMTGRLLADFGADVVQVEPPEGSAARSCPPVAVVGGRQRSMYWSAYAANKRGVAVDLTSRGGRADLLDLVAAADFFVTSYPASDLARWGLRWEQLRTRHPGLVYVRITPFGSTGPKQGYAASDLVVWAAGGPLDPHRDDDRPPVRISSQQAFLHAAADAAAGALIAHLARCRTGRGQLVDVSAQTSVAMASLARVLADGVGDPDPDQDYDRKPVDQSGSGAATPPREKKWQCRDGFIELHIGMGPGAGAFTNNLVAWMRAEHHLDDDLAAADWRVMPRLVAEGSFTPRQMERFRRAVADFFRNKTKAEANAAAIEHRVLCTAIADVADVAGSAQLEHRGVWVTVGSGDREQTIPGPAARISVAAYAFDRPAPECGEHTAEVRREWLDGPEPARSWRPGRTGHAGETALHDLKVLDLSWLVAGPTIGRTLADFGATVVRVESRTRLDSTRVMHPFHGGIAGVENSALYGNCNAGKLGVALDLSRTDAREVALDLARWADVVIESFSPGVVARWGLDYPALSAGRPDLIMLSASMCGQSGPMSRMAGYGNMGSSLSGIQALGGWPDRPPLGTFGPYTDYLTPRYALVALLSALDHRRRTGQGCYLDVAHLDTGAYFLAPELADHLTTGTVAGRHGNRDLRHAPHGVYPCRDGRFVAIAVCDDDQWCRLATLIGGRQLAADRRFTTAPQRRALAGDLDEMVARWTRDRNAEHTEQLLQRHGVAAHVSASASTFLTDPQIRHRRHLVSLPHPVHGSTLVENSRFQLSGTPGRVRRAAPLLGQDTARVLTDLLGYPVTRVDELDAAGAFG
nr:CoA transferase [uncultured Actinoplanes sp.]